MHMYSIIRSHFSSNDFSDVTVVECNQNYTTDQYSLHFANSKQVVILMFDDHFWYGDLSSLNDIRNESLDNIVEVTQQFSDKNIILLTENFYANDELGSNIPENLTIVTSPFCMYAYDNGTEIVDYAVTTKRFDSSHHVLCLNNKPRPHRVGVVLYLLSLNLDKNVHMSFMSSEYWDSEKPLDFYDRATILSYLYPYSKLYDVLSNISLVDKFKESAEYVYCDGTNTYSNFDNFFKLLPLYTSTVIEIITESTALENTPQLNEKFVHCVIGRCFPIVIGTFKNVEIYREMGYDMFDDIIDHSYDYETNPFYRMKMAIDANIDILTNKELAVSLYYKHKERLNKNVEHYKNHYDVVLYDAINSVDANISI